MISSPWLVNSRIYSCWFTCCQSQWAQVNLRPAIKTGKVTGNQRECPFSANQKHWKWRHRTHTQTPHKARCCSWISWQTIIALHPQSSVFVMSGRHFSRLTFRQLTRNDISGHYLHDYLQMRMHLKPKSCHAYNHPKNCTAYAYNHPKNCTASAYNHPKNGTANVSQSQRWIFCKLQSWLWPYLRYIVAVSQLYHSHISAIFQPNLAQISDKSQPYPRHIAAISQT